MRATLQFKLFQHMSDQLESLKTHLAIVKNLPADKIEEQFYNLMVKAKDTLGETSYQMGLFYYEYGNFIMSKLQKNLDIFNANAVPDNVNEQPEDNLDDIQQVYDDSESSLQQGEAELPQKPQDPQSPEPQQQNQQQSNGAAQQEGEIQPQPVQQQPEEAPEQDVDDKEITLCNIEFAIRIFEAQLQKVKSCQSETPIKQILDGLRRAKTRLGDFYMLDEQYVKAVDEYRSVIAQQEQREDSQSNRLIAELHFLIGNCFLYDNKQGCQTLAIQEFIKAVNILVNYLSLIEHYDITAFEVPYKDKYQVDRFAYLNKPNDSEKVKEVKQIITCLLDKIEDTSEQIGVRAAYELEKKREEEQKKKSQFKPVEQGAKVVNLGSFGNRKKKPEEPKEQKEKSNE